VDPAFLSMILLMVFGVGAGQMLLSTAVFAAIAMAIGQSFTATCVI